MKFLIIVFIMLQLSTALWADKSYDQYINMKKEAYALYENHKTNEAFTYVKSFISKHPESIRAQNLLAVLYYWNGDLSKSKSILQVILSKETFPQAASLLQNIEQKEGKQSKLILTSGQKKVEKNSKQKPSSADLLYLVQKIKKDPHDALSRKILALHYKKIGNTKQANYFANETLKIDPDDSDMVALVKNKDDSTYGSKQMAAKAFHKLEEFYESKSYDRFINLYTSLEHNNVIMPTDIHVNALYCAIELGLYQKAKSIIHIYRMPKNRYMAQIEELLDEKLMLSRFASAED